MRRDIQRLSLQQKAFIRYAKLGTAEGFEAESAEGPGLGAEDGCKLGAGIFGGHLVWQTVHLMEQKKEYWMDSTMGRHLAHWTE
jgi:hypothetical protein